MPLMRIGSAAAVRKTGVAEAAIDGNTYAICSHAGEIHVFDASCPCTGGPLGQGVIRNGLLVCPWHGMRYDARTGVCPYDASLSLIEFKVELQGDDILIDVPSQNP
jgi:nitrite reductase/ring-hydroxylating ferredoxin subunit